MPVDLLYMVDKDCALCGRAFPVARVRNRLRMLRQDSDFCTVYADINPYYYDIWVCPHCGYAAQENWFADLKDSAADKLKDFLNGKDVRIAFGGERSRAQALDAYRLAIFYAGLTGQPASRLGALFLRMAWLFREAEDEVHEQLALVEARKHYEQALMRESLPIGNMSELTLEYLVAELYRRTGELERALAGFSRVVGNPKAKLEKRLLEMAREAWQQTRDQREGRRQAQSQEAELMKP